MEAIKNIVQLRQFLAERLPNVRTLPPGLASLRKERAGSGQFDQFLPGALVKGSVTEMVGSGRSSGSALMIRWLLRRAHELGHWLVLVDGQDSFDPTVLDQAILSRLLWVRCADTAQALKATDLVLRDDNFRIIVLDLLLNPSRQLRKITATVWYRFQRLIAHHDAIFLVVTPERLVSGAQARVVLRSQFGLEALHKSEDELMAQLRIDLKRSRGKERELDAGSGSSAQMG